MWSRIQSRSTQRALLSWIRAGPAPSSHSAYRRHAIVAASTSVKVMPSAWCSATIEAIVNGSPPARGAVDDHGACGSGPSLVGVAATGQSPGSPSSL